MKILSLSLCGREKVIENFHALYAERRHVLMVGPPGIGKTALLQRLSETCPMLLCEETTGLRRICDSLEGHLRRQRDKLNVIERKNQLLACLERRGELVAFDQVGVTPPRVAHFIGNLAERIPVWIACRSDSRKHIGHVWEHLYKFARVEIPPLTRGESCALIEDAVGRGIIQPDARQHVVQLHRISNGIPRVLEQLLLDLAARKYKINRSVGLNLLELDRRIHEFTRATFDPEQ